MNAARAGVVALALLGAGCERGEAPSERGGAPADRPPPHAEVRDERVWADLERLSVPRTPLGGPEQLAALLEAEAWLAQRLAEAGHAVALDPFEADFGPRAPGAPTTWHNLVVEIRGVERPGEVVLFGAHFDSVPDSPGADDNASGVAALLELARVLHGREPARTIRLVAFNLEEVGLLGARAYASDALARERAARQAGLEPERIVAMVTLEMLGSFSDEPGSQRSPVGEIPGVFTPPTVGNFIAIVAIQRDSAIARAMEAAMRSAVPELPVLRFDVMPIPVPDMLRSDHAPFLGIGVPALMLTDTSEFRYPYYHTPEDTPDKLDRTRYLLAVRAAAAAAWALANPEPGAP